MTSFVIRTKKWSSVSRAEKTTVNCHLFVLYIIKPKNPIFDWQASCFCLTKYKSTSENSVFSFIYAQLLQLGLLIFIQYRTKYMCMLLNIKFNRNRNAGNKIIVHRIKEYRLDWIDTQSTASLHKCLLRR